MEELYIRQCTDRELLMDWAVALKTPSDSKLPGLSVFELQNEVLVTRNVAYYKDREFRRKLYFPFLL